MRQAAALLLALAGASCSGGAEPAAPAAQEAWRAEFRGAEEISESALRELVSPDLERFAAEPRASVLDDAVYRLTHRYQLDGFRDVRVTARQEEGKLVFEIREGTRFQVGRVHFRGNRAIRDEDLEALVPEGLLGARPVYSPRLRGLLEDGIASMYRARGYIDVGVTATENPGAEGEGLIHLSFEIAEGRAFSVAAIEGLDGIPVLGEELGRLVGRPYTPGTADAVETAVTDHFRENGHPRASAGVTSRIDRENGRVFIAVESRPGPAARIGELDVKGAERTRLGFVESRADLERGAAYRASDLRRAEDRLAETRIFRSVLVQPGALQEETGDLAVDVSLEEREIAEVAVRGGYGSFEGPRVGSDFSLSNLVGGAEFLRLGGSVSAVGWRTEAEFGLPYLLGTEFRLGTSAYTEDREFPSFDAVSWGGVVSLSYPLARALSATAGFRRAAIRTDDVDPSVPPGDLLDFEYSAPFVSSILDLRDNPILPSKGFFAQGELAWSPVDFGSDVTFLNVSGRLSGFVPLPAGFVAAASVQGGVIDPIGKTDEIPISLRYFAGGTHSVRGFKFDSIGPEAGGEPTGGEATLALQSELRFPLWGGLHGAVFTDRGGVWFRWRDVDLDETRWSVGAGLRYYTAAGALVADVGWNPRTEDGEHPVELHVSIGFPF